MLKMAAASIIWYFTGIKPVQVQFVGIDYATFLSPQIDPIQQGFLWLGDVVPAVSRSLFLETPEQVLGIYNVFLYLIARNHHPRSSCFRSKTEAGLSLTNGSCRSASLVAHSIHALCFGWLSAGQVCAFSA